MKQNSEEQKIRQLFRDARQTDEQHAPAFAATLAAAQSGAQHNGWRLNGRRIAFAALALIALGVAAFVYFQPANQTAFELTVKPVPVPYYPNSPVAVDPSAASPEAVIAMPRAHSKPPHRRPHVAQPQTEAGQMALLSFKWQSPTDFLLRTPGADLLKSVPRLGDSLIRMNVIHPGEKN